MFGLFEPKQKVKNSFDKMREIVGSGNYFRIGTFFIGYVEKDEGLEIIFGLLEGDGYAVDFRRKCVIFVKDCSKE